MTITLRRLQRSEIAEFVSSDRGIRRFDEWQESVLSQIEAEFGALAAAQVAQAAAVTAQAAAVTAQAAAASAQADATAALAAVAAIPSDTRTVTADTAVTSSDSVINVDATGGMVIVTLLSALSPYPVTIKKIDASANAVRIAAQGGDTINGAAAFDFTTQGETHVCTNDGVNAWYA